MAQKRLLLIDGHSMAYRAFFALPAENFTTAQGQHTNAIYGFATMLISLLKDEKPTHVAVAFDVSRKTFRTDIFPDYKANRAKTPDEFRSQMSYLNDLVTGFGITQFALEGYEADDIIATITKQAEREGAEVLICTGDRDSFQLVTEKTTVLYPKRGVSEMARMTPDAVQEKYGMSPDQYPDFAALRGDPSDNLPSIPGVGEKTAAKWIVEYGSLKDLISNVDKVGGKVGQSLRDNIDDVIRNRELTQLVHDAPIEYQVDALAWAGVVESDLTKLFEQLEFRTLKDRLKPILNPDSVVKEVKGQSNNVEFTLFAPMIEGGTLSPEELSEKIAQHSGDIALSFELLDEKLHRYAVAFNPSDVYLIHSEQMGEWAQNPKVSKIAHDAKSLARENLLDGVVFDTALAAYLVNPGVRAQELSDLLERWGDGAQIDTSSPEQSLLTGAAALFKLRGSLLTEMKDRGVLALFTDLELPIAHLLAVMENRGIAVDRKELEKLATFFEGEVTRETKAAHLAAGHEFNVASPKQLQVVLFDELNLPKTKKIKTGFTTDAEALNWLFEKTKHPLLESLLRIRETKKLGTTVEGLIAEIGSDGRIRTHFAQTVAATGRLSSVGPNLQNIPVRTEEGRSIRNAFIADKGFSGLLTADYSQIEMRIMAHLSNDAGLLAAFETGEDLHATVAGLVFGVKANEVDSEMRRQIKAMSYGLAYGLSSYGLAAQLDLSPPAAQDLMDRYFQRFGGIRDYLSSVVVQARKVGYTETVMGRRRYLPDLMHDNRQRREIAERMALNAPIQGSAADIIKQAMLNVERALISENLKSRLLLQVHDELILEVVAGEEEVLTDLVRREMGSAFPLRAPLDVSVGIGKSWNEAAH
ncbi:DNA polymerase I [Candidatus Planktophila lacus]|jgi:DNA polymerase-1|uniref:DNA polymerase I n=1 Tax=Candidatus Planktophila lacus TaxID=1884913 RepID=A0AAC9YS10_9ACTN|nr:DNA polymerase I [Candidatus Planktophila lacus]ASY10544.1 DNA polymerase I [Candidatus Planktophila lacus]ASY25001.1 DNA polymerase I [Candidatus Planktophila lacus]